jgi:hypothetical protein
MGDRGRSTLTSMDSGDQPNGSMRWRMTSIAMYGSPARSRTDHSAGEESSMRLLLARRILRIGRYHTCRGGLLVATKSARSPVRCQSRARERPAPEQTDRAFRSARRQYPPRRWLLTFSAGGADRHDRRLAGVAAATATEIRSGPTPAATISTFGRDDDSLIPHPPARCRPADRTRQHRRPRHLRVRRRGTKPPAQLHRAHPGW